MKRSCGVVLVLFVLFMISSCTSFNETRNKSFAVDQKGLQRETIESLTIFPIKDTSSVSGLSEELESELSRAFHSELPKGRIADANTFRSQIAEKNLINEYSQWRLAFDETKIISLPPLKKWSQVLGTRYFLLVGKVFLAREKVNAHDVKFTGWTNDASNFWRTDLKIYAQIIDSESGTAIWKGVGHAENVFNPKQFGNRHNPDCLIIWTEKTPEIEEYIKPMIKVAVDGLVANIFPTGASVYVR